MSSKGIIQSINISVKKGEKKTPITSAQITLEGIQGDAHAGTWHRQISLLSEEHIEQMKTDKIQLSPGDFAENITTKGIDLNHLSIGQQLKIGDTAILEITQIGKECHSGCAIRDIVGDCIMPRKGLFSKVIQPGRIKIGDPIQIIQ